MQKKKVINLVYEKVAANTHSRDNMLKDLSAVMGKKQTVSRVKKMLNVLKDLSAVVGNKLQGSFQQKYLILGASLVLDTCIYPESLTYFFLKKFSHYKKKSLYKDGYIW